MHSHVHDIQCGIFSSLFVTSFPALSTVAAVATCMCVVVKAGVLGLLLQGERMNLWFAKIMMNAEISLLSTGHQVMPTTEKNPRHTKAQGFHTSCNLLGVLSLLSTRKLTSASQVLLPWWCLRWTNG